MFPVSVEDRRASVYVSGEIDVATAPQLESAIAEAYDRDPEAVVVDLTRVTLLDSSGLGVLLRGSRRGDESGVPFRVEGARGIVQEVLRFSGVWAILTGASP